MKQDWATRDDLVTVILADTGAQWTMSVMEDEDDEERDIGRDRCRAAIGLVAEDGVELYGCWGDRKQYHTQALCNVVFPQGTRVLCAYQPARAR